MTIKFAHLREGNISFAVFDADARSGRDADRSELLAELTARARASSLRIDKAALAYRKGRGVEYFGTPDLVKYLATRAVTRWTHRIEL
jgi:hypothetical protein